MFFQRRNLKILFFLYFFLFISGILIFSAHSVPFITKETELSMGRSANKEVLQQFGFYQDKALEVYVNKIGQKLVSKLINKEFSNYYFRIVDSSEINAFALPGGYIYVTRGLLASLNSEGELASVIGHEIAHVTMHHGAKMMIRSLGAQILSIGGAIASPKNASQWLAVSSAMFQQINMGYGREAELEADAQGMMISMDAGYKPHEMINFLNNLRKQEIMSGQSYHSFQATHPDTKERIVKSGLIASSLSGKHTNLISNRDTYISQLQGLVYGGKKHSKDTRRYKPRYLQIYTIKKGDTLESIALKELGDKRHALEIAVTNGIKETAPLKPNSMIKIIKEGLRNQDKLLRLSRVPSG